MNRSRDELRSALDHVFRAFNQVGAVYAWRIVAENHEYFEHEAQYRRDMLHNAAIESTLVNIRALNEFFKPAGRKDDLRADQYPGYRTKGAFLASQEEEQINKRMAHLTWRLEAPDPGWLVRAHIQAAIERMLDFLDYLIGSFLKWGEAEFDHALRLRKSLPSYLEAVVV